MDLNTKQANYISRAVAAAPQILATLQTCDALFAEWSALGYATGGANEITDDDFTGANAHLDADTLNAVIYVYGVLGGAADAAARAALYETRP